MSNQLPDGPCCAKCVFYSPNQGVPVTCVDDKQCYKHNTWTDDEMVCDEFLPPTATEVNVPCHAPKGIMFQDNPNKLDGPTEVFIVSFSKDFEWLTYALRSIARYFTGFQGVTIAHPAHEAALFNTLHSNFDIRLHGYDEVAGKGMLHHMAKMAQADLVVPPGTKYVLHTDSDGIFKMASTPESFFWNGKPTYLIRTWASLGVPDHRHPIAKTVSDCGMWKPYTDQQLGWDTEWYTMCLNTQAMPIEFYAPYRDYLENLHKRPFVEYMVDGQNVWPQSKMDWTAYGAWAHKFQHDKFTWYDVENGQPYPMDRKKAFHSHSGFTPAIRAEIESMLK